NHHFIYSFPTRRSSDLPLLNFRSFIRAIFSIGWSLYFNAIPDEVPNFSSDILATIEIWKISLSRFRWWPIYPTKRVKTSYAVCCLKKKSKRQRREGRSNG